MTDKPEANAVSAARVDPLDISSIDEVIHLITIAYSAGYESGHHDTVEGIFIGSGAPEMHDTDAVYWLKSAKFDGTFERSLLI